MRKRGDWLSGLPSSVSRPIESKWLRFLGSSVKTGGRRHWWGLGNLRTSSPGPPSMSTSWAYLLWRLPETGHAHWRWTGCHHNPTLPGLVGLDPKGSHLCPESLAAVWMGLSNHGAFLRHSSRNVTKSCGLLLTSKRINGGQLLLSTWLGTSPHACRTEFHLFSVTLCLPLEPPVPATCPHPLNASAQPH